MKRKLALMLVISLILSLGAFSTVSFAATDTIVTTGADLKEALTNCKGGTVTIAGEDTLADGTKGIILPDNYSPVSGFYGTIRGVDDKNNIQLATTSGSEHGLISSINTGDSTTTIENLVLKGVGTDGNSTISTQLHSTAGTAALIGYVNKSTATVIIKNVTNHVNVTDSTKNAGGLIAYIYGGSVTIENCLNDGNITSSKGKSGGFVGSGRAGSLTVKDSVNYGVITGSDRAGGIYGGAYNTSTGYITLTIEKCANYGSILSHTKNAGGIAGSGSVATVSKSFNAGNVESNYRYAAGILASTGSSSIVTDSFNVGSISVKGDAQSAGSVFGIASGDAVVSNCYNLGDFIAYNSEKDKYYSPYAITDSETSGSKNNYYTNDVEVKDAKDIATKTTIEELATDFLSNLNPAGGDPVWCYTEDPSYNYSLPQIIGNEFVNDKNKDWYKAPEEEITVGPASDDILFAKGEDTEFDAQLAEDGITGGYAIVASKFTVPSGEFKFGMLLSEEDLGEDLTFENENYSADAKGKNHCEGAFGILFYGNKLKNGNTYYVRPYVLFNGIYTYGAPTSFVFSAE